MAVHYPVGPWVRITIFFQVEKLYRSTIWFKSNGTGMSTTNPGAVAAAWNVIFSPLFAAVMNPAATYVGCRAYLNNGVFTISGTAKINTTGSGGDELLPGDVCGLVTLDADVGTRKGVGRIFISGLDSTMVSGSYISTGGMANFQDIVNALLALTEIGGVNAGPAVWTRSPSALNPANNINYGAIVGSRRKRRPSF